MPPRVAATRQVAHHAEVRRGADFRTSGKKHAAGPFRILLLKCHVRRQAASLSTGTGRAFLWQVVALFSLWVPLALQLVVPLLLVGWVAAGWGPRNVQIAVAALSALYLAAIGLAGLWVVLPWWLPFVYAILLLAAARSAFVQARPATAVSRGALVVLGLGGVLLSVIIVLTFVARRPPGNTIELAFPLRDGTFLVVNGGNHLLINAHLGTLEGDRFRPYRGQSYGVDIVRLDRLGLRARGLLSNDPRAYLIFGHPVVAPCAGVVVAAVDGLPDMSPPEPDRSHMAGNHVILDCAGTWVLLGHFERGSIAVRKGETIPPGASLGRVGNSGNSGEPHLHIHAQRPGSVEEPISGEPVAVRLGGRYLVRNARVNVTSETR